MSAISHEFPDSYEQYYDLEWLEERAERRRLMREADTADAIIRARALLAEYVKADEKRAEQTYEPEYEDEGEDG